MIAFHCENCGQKFRMPESRAGKKGRCPKCKGVILVPEIQGAGPAPPDSENSPYDLTLLEVPLKDRTPTEPQGQSDVSGEVTEDTQASLLGYRTPESEPPPERKLPWLIDIFLYPTSTPGLTILAITVGVPLLLHILVKLLAIWTMVFTPMFVFLMLFQVLRIMAVIVFFLYVYWYFCECIRDSALGGLRAPETAGSTPGLAELLWPLLRIIACAAFCSLPAVIYMLYVRKPDKVFWVLYGCGVFFFPMGLLAVIMFDAIRALNPVLVIGSIFSTFFQYFGLVLFYYIPAVLLPTMVYFLPRSWILGHITKLAAFYLGFVSAHLLGRFYFRYQEKLNWEV